MNVATGHDTVSSICIATGNTFVLKVANHKQQKQVSTWEGTVDR